VTALGPAGGPGAAASSIGTLAHLEEVRPLGAEAYLLRLTGRRLVRLIEAQERAGRWWAKVAEVAEPDGEAASLIEEAESSLRRYLALRAEAGEAGDVHTKLSRDPVAASHEVASHLRISWPEVQDILEAGGAAERLRRARAVLDRETELLRRLLGREGS
jgi:Lon protease-like protein